MPFKVGDFVTYIQHTNNPDFWKVKELVDGSDSLFGCPISTFTGRVWRHVVPVRIEILRLATDYEIAKLMAIRFNPILEKEFDAKTGHWIVK